MTCHDEQLMRLIDHFTAPFPTKSNRNSELGFPVDLQARKQTEKMEEAIDVGGDADERLQSAVAAGISEARQRVLSEPNEGRAQAEPSAGTSAVDTSVQQPVEHAVSSPESEHVGDSSMSGDGEEAVRNQDVKERELVAESRNSNTS